MKVLEDAGITVLDRGATVHEIKGIEVGIVGTRRASSAAFRGRTSRTSASRALLPVYAEGMAEARAIGKP